MTYSLLLTPSILLHVQNSYIYYRQTNAYHLKPKHIKNIDQEIPKEFF